MKKAHIALSIVCLVIATGATCAVAQSTKAWRVEGTRKAPPFRLVLSEVGEGVSYIFDCSGPMLAITKTGVTSLLDMKASDNARVPDNGDGRVMPQGSALLAVATDRSEPDFVMGTAKPNSTKGWDITIEVPRHHKSVQDFGRAQFLSLFTTGFTAAVMLEKADRKILADFMQECRK